MPTSTSNVTVELWCVYFAAAIDDDNPKPTYRTRGIAELAAACANDRMLAVDSDGKLCGFQAFGLVDSEWISTEELDAWGIK